MSNLLGSGAGRFGCAIETSPLHEASRNTRPKSVVGNAKPALRRGDGGYVDWVIVSIHGLKTYLDLPYRRLLDVLNEMSRIGRIIGLAPVDFPDFTTVYARMQNLKIPLWREFLRMSAELHDSGEIQAIDATGMNRVATSQHYAQRTNYTLKAVKTTAMSDCKNSTILDIHCSMKQPHDTQVAWQLLPQNLEKLSILTADKVTAGSCSATNSVLKVSNR